MNKPIPELLKNKAEPVQVIITGTDSAFYHIQIHTRRGKLRTLWDPVRYRSRSFQGLYGNPAVSY